MAGPMLVARETKKNKTWSGKQEVLVSWRILIQYKKGDGKEASKKETHWTGRA